jgi:hypothetical protein
MRCATRRSENMLRSVKCGAVAVVLAVLVATSVWAMAPGNVTGTWRDTHNGVYDNVTIVFVQHDDGTLTGTIGYPNRPQDEILEGTITRKGEVSFLIDTVTPNGYPFRGIHRGRLQGNGNRIQGNYVYTVTIDGQDTTSTVSWLAFRNQ